jgi:hypothetical protein
MIAHHVVCGTHRFRISGSIYLLLNYREEAVGELQEDGYGTFLKV